MRTKYLLPISRFLVMSHAGGFVVGAINHVRSTARNQVTTYMRIAERGPCRGQGIDYSESPAARSASP